MQSVLRDGAALMVKPYMSTAELAALTPWTEQAIKAMVRRGILVRGGHYYQPFGSSTQLLFKWSSIVLLIEQGPVVEDETKRGFDIDEAAAQARRLLG